MRSGTLVKLFLITILIVSFASPLLALSTPEARLVGTWGGELDISVLKLRLVVHLDSTDNRLTATLDSPDQGANGIPVDSAFVAADSLHLLLFALAARFEGRISANVDSLEGTWTQGGKSFPLTLTRGAAAIERRRPQEPQPPFPYRSEDVQFHNQAADITLAGTLTLPETGTNFPAVVMISGSGPQNRNEEVMSHKPFLVISDFLTRHGIAVLRFDDRGVGDSDGEFATATTQDFATDAEAAVDFLKGRPEIDKHKIGLIGHSEGGIIAPMVAVNDNDVAFIVLLAGTGVKGSEVLALQELRIMEASGADSLELAKLAALRKEMLAITNTDQPLGERRERLTELLEQQREGVPEEQWDAEGLSDIVIAATVEQYLSPWMQFFFRHDPATTLEKVNCPVLALNGALDLQVIPEQNLPAIEAALKLGGNSSYKIVKLDGLNHLFQHTEIGLPAEYATIEETFAPEALELIAGWIKAVTE